MGQGCCAASASAPGPISTHSTSKSQDKSSLSPTATKYALQDEETTNNAAPSPGDPAPLRGFAVVEIKEPFNITVVTDTNEIVFQDPDANCVEIESSLWNVQGISNRNWGKRLIRKFTSQRDFIEAVKPALDGKKVLLQVDGMAATGQYMLWFVISALCNKSSGFNTMEWRAVVLLPTKDTPPSLYGSPVAHFPLMLAMLSVAQERIESLVFVPRHQFFAFDDPLVAVQASCTAAQLGYDTAPAVIGCPSAMRFFVDVAKSFFARKSYVRHPLDTIGFDEAEVEAAIDVISDTLLDESSMIQLPDLSGSQSIGSAPGLSMAKSFEGWVVIALGARAVSAARQLEAQLKNGNEQCGTIAYFTTAEEVQAAASNGSLLPRVGKGWKQLVVQLIYIVDGASFPFENAPLEPIQKAIAAMDAVVKAESSKELEGMYGVQKVAIEILPPSSGGADPPEVMGQVAMAHHCIESSDFAVLVDNETCAAQLAGSIIETSLCLRMVQHQLVPYSRISHCRAFLCSSLEELGQVIDKVPLAWGAFIVACGPTASCAAIDEAAAKLQRAPKVWDAEAGLDIASLPIIGGARSEAVPSCGAQYILLAQTCEMVHSLHGLAEVAQKHMQTLDAELLGEWTTWIDSAVSLWEDYREATAVQ